MKPIREHDQAPRGRPRLAGGCAAGPGFTLIEIMAVVLIIALTMTLVIPNLTSQRSSLLRKQAVGLAGRLELARERAIVTGIPHRVMIDLQEGSYSIDWFVTEARAYGLETAPAVALATSEPAATEISLLPPKEDERDYYAIPNKFGQPSWLEDEYYFRGVTTPDGWVERGSVQIVFESDGTTDYAEIQMADAWDNAVVLVVEPLLDTVRIETAEGR